MQTGDFVALSRNRRPVVTLPLVSAFTAGLALAACSESEVFLGEECAENAGGQPFFCPWTFRDATAEAGFDFVHGYTFTNFHERDIIAGGAAVSDYDGDGDIDVYAGTGNATSNVLYRNRGDGTFEEVAAAAGVDLPGHHSSGAYFGDIDGDRLLDLLVTGTRDFHVLFKNMGDGTFEELPREEHLPVTEVTFSAAMADYDRDGDLDLFLTHWAVMSFGLPPDLPKLQLLWQNDGTGHFQDVSSSSGLSGAWPVEFLGAGPTVFSRQFGFAPNFVDINSDGWLDILLSEDFGNSKVLMNNGGWYSDATSSVISDENGMGAAVGDYDNDGDLDWFVSSIWDPDQTTGPSGNWGVSGNRLYKNDGAGNFSDATDEAGVREGYWGWGSCFADFNNDGHLDLFHVNGHLDLFPVNGFIRGPEFVEDPSRLYISNGDGTFSEMSVDLGIDDRQAGRGISCFDVERDGDIDIFIMNNMQAPRLYRNDGGNQGNWINVRLRGRNGNAEGIGARITIESKKEKQIREIRSGSNFVSQNPAEAHFGLGDKRWVKEIHVRWPDGVETVKRFVRANRQIFIEHPNYVPPPK